MEVRQLLKSNLGADLALSIPSFLPSAGLVVLGDLNSGIARGLFRRAG